MDFENVILERDDGIATIRMNRPKEMNTLNFGLTRDLLKALEVCWDDAELEKVTTERTRRIVKGPLAAFAIAKDNLNRAMLGLLEIQLEQERLGIMKSGRTRDAREGIAAILERRKPEFRGE